MSVITILILFIAGVNVTQHVVGEVTELTTLLNDSTDESTKYPILIPPSDTFLYEIDFGGMNFLEVENKSSVDWENGFRRCGEKLDFPFCPFTSEEVRRKKRNHDDPGESETGEEPAPTSTTSPPPATFFMGSPALCRCDEKCIKFGDCCAPVLKRLKKIPLDRYWRCMKLLDTEYAVRMISKCPPDYPDKLNKELCENQRYPVSPKSKWTQAPLVLLDVPVWHNETGDIYRSIYCARCHSVSSKEVHFSKYELRCSNFSDRSEWEDFRKIATYKQGKLRWEDPRNESIYCSLYFEDLAPENISKIIPDVRFCYSEAEEECDIDLTSEENQTLNHLCSSYTQVVRLQRSPKKNETGMYSPIDTFKNPHCAKCKHPNIDIRKDPQCVRMKFDSGRAPGPLFKLFPKPNGPVGINILFHFSLVEDGPVGYTSKCDDNEILDFIRQTCVRMICPKGYELNDGTCEKIEYDPGDIIEEGGNDTSIIVPRLTNESTETSSNSSTSSESESGPCLLLLRHPGEYQVLENGSITMNKSDSSGIIMFDPGKYERYNETTISICADLRDTFKEGFAPALSYISNILLALSVLCSFAHVILYMVLPKMRNLPGNNLLCLTSCLFISQFIFLTFIKASNHCVCVVASIIMHYLFLAAFCWMNIMSFDIWRTFSNAFLIRRYSGDSARTFLKYSIFAWTVPLVIVTLAVITDFTLPDFVLQDPEFGPLMKKLRPLYGQNNLCWIGQRLSLFVFFAFPVALIIFCNFILFTLTATTIWLQNREGNKFINSTIPSSVMVSNGNGKNGQLKHKESGSGQGFTSGCTKQSDTLRFKLYAKLALIMGLTWILGFLSGFTQWEWLWYPFVIFNGLQGTFIFVAFDCKWKIWQMVKDECGWWQKMQRKHGEGDDGTSELRRRGTSTLSTGLRSSSRTSNASSVGNAFIISDKEMEAGLNGAK